VINNLKVQPFFVKILTSKLVSQLSSIFIMYLASLKKYFLCQNLALNRFGCVFISKTFNKGPRKRLFDTV
jgi:hypothetical protein